VKNLITQILREFVDSSDIEIKILGPDYKITLNEKIENYVPQEIVNIVDEFVEFNSPFQGEFIDKKTNKKKTYTFYLDVTDHYINRLYRTMDPKYSADTENNRKIINPSTLEGLYMIVDNADKLAEQLAIGRIKDNFKVELSSKKMPKYSVIVDFDEVSSGNKFKLSLLTQIKGVDFYDKKENFKLSLRTIR
jgi:hypothetical protein